MPLVLFPLGGVMDAGQTAANYGADIIFLFLGGFMLAIAMERWNLHTRVALNIINVIGTTTSRIILGFMLATAIMSMFVSNTAAVMIMIPIGLALILEAESLVGNDNNKVIRKFEKVLVLAIGYAGTIGGLGTLIGTPPLIILSGQMQEMFAFEINFAKWMMVGIPVVIILLILSWLYLTIFVFKSDLKELPGGKETIQNELKQLGKMTMEEITVLVVFFLAALLWIVRGFVSDIQLFSLVQDGTIAIFITVLLFILPARSKGGNILDWSVAKDVPWGVLLLFGGGLTIAKAITESSLDVWLSAQLVMVKGLPIILIVAIVSLFVLMLTEITSNTATATMILPLLGALAITLDVHPMILMAPAAMAANCAFMLPVGTPPNAIVFGTGKVAIKDMVSVGFWLNIIAWIVIVIVAIVLLPIVFNFDISPFPSTFK
ncbi:Sodium-dependent dicarboxylate transporter SdcS [Phocicoccus pinnipedialis]|uniref:Sodium-dependent dicarboxylate transporter SdcS n=1 Tax=Phocicoccus pinnipedialis TaxID=110845 RepID=A0A6V7RF62_9BACL|nr:Sodium-dependent dicarboxylate transporter SdcS [Jeotgalicoccus pinnipedialis]